jgi:hypothetical protein
MRALHGPLVIFFLVAEREFLILSTCDLATRLLRLCNNLFLDMELTLRGCVLVSVSGLWPHCVFGCNARIEGLRILRLPDVKPPCLTCPRRKPGAFSFQLLKRLPARLAHHRLDRCGPHLGHLKSTAHNRVPQLARIAHKSAHILPLISGNAVRQ